MTALRIGTRGSLLALAQARAVAAAYRVVFVGVLAWVAIIATKLARLQREVAELVELARRRRERDAA